MPKITWHRGVIQRIQVSVCIIVVWIYVNFFCPAPIDIGSILNIIPKGNVFELRVKIALGAWVLSVHRDRALW